MPMPAHAKWTPRRFAWLDGLIILSVAVGLWYAIAALPRQNGATVNIFREGRLIARYPLSENRDVTIDGAIGKLVLRIENGSARVVSASCKEKICIATGAIRRSSQEIVCVPNRVMITVSSSRSDFDAFTK
jgi:hypothetical protein